MLASALVDAFRENHENPDALFFELEGGCGLLSAGLLGF